MHKDLLNPTGKAFHVIGYNFNELRGGGGGWGDIKNFPCEYFRDKYLHIRRNFSNILRCEN